MPVQGLDHRLGVAPAQGFDKAAGVPQILAHPHLGEGD